MTPEEREMFDDSEFPEDFMDFLMDESGLSYRESLVMTAMEFGCDVEGLDIRYMGMVMELMAAMPPFDQDTHNARERYRLSQLREHGPNTDLWDPEPTDVLEQHFGDYTTEGSQHFEDYIDDHEEYDDA